MRRLFVPPPIPSSQITPEAVYLRRRAFITATAAATAAAATGATGAHARAADVAAAGDAQLPRRLEYRPARPDGIYTDEPETPYADAMKYNNFYEFGSGKGDPAKNAKNFRTEPWSVKVSGHADKTGTLALEDILAPHALEERVYRLRCVEAWSMVVPWIGFSLGDLLRRFEPTSRARYVVFKTLHDPERMPAQRRGLLSFGSIDWPYVEGLRMDEAMNPLAMMVVGMYGRALPGQNGAPLRLIVPWKYGFKSIKSIVEINFAQRRPVTTWERQAPSEYGFYANVNPEVSHPRWSQASERRLPSGWFASRIPTRMFNGYSEQVAHLYKGMDLSRDF